MKAVLVARYTVKPGQMHEVLESLKAMAARVASDEPKCTLYNANLSIEDENVVCLYEVYTDEDALVAHRETPHFKEIIEGSVVPRLVNREREIYRQVLG